MTALAQTQPTGEEFREFIDGRSDLMLSTLTPQGEPFASCAPFAAANGEIYVALSQLTIHAVNLQLNGVASVMFVSGKDNVRQTASSPPLSYMVKSTLVEPESDEWKKGIRRLSSRVGTQLSSGDQLSDLKLFRLSPQRGCFTGAFNSALSNTADGAALH